MQNTDANLTRLHVNELRIGMRVCRLETLNNESPFLLDIIDIRTQAQIQQIQKVCDYVYVDSKSQKAQHGYIPTRSSNAEKQLSFARAFGQIESNRQNTINLIKSVFDDIRFGNQLNVTSVKEAVSKCVEDVLHQTDAMLLLMQLKDKNEYTAQHSMNVCVLSILLGRQINLSIENLNNIGICGLLHDIGKMKIPQEILNKPGSLDENEINIMRKHTAYGRDVLISARNIYPGTVDVAYSHHELLDGKGYPRGLGHESISDFTKIVTIVDNYDAITSDRVYRSSKSHVDALAELIKGMNSHFDSNYVTQFINCIGFYPQGNFVELSSGDIGVVVEQNKKDRLKPKILLILDSNKNHVEHRILDLGLNPVDEGGNNYRVRKMIKPDDYGINFRDLYNQGIFTNSYQMAG